MSFKLKLWGVRGSLPTPQSIDQMEQKLVDVLEKYREQGATQNPKDFVKTLGSDTLGFGGNTICVQYMTPKTQIIVDGGSGIRALGDTLMAGPCGEGHGDVRILMTHFHWDHLVGLPFFVPLFIPGNTVHFYAVQPDLEVNVRRLFAKPNFPVPFERLPAKIVFHRLSARQSFSIGDIQVTPYQLDHPDPCYGYRLEAGGKVMAHCVDTEGRRISREELGLDVQLYQNVDLMVFDAQYSFLEAAEKVDWGHASGPIGLDLALRERVKKVLFIHHDPAAPDRKIAEAERQTREYYDACHTAAKAMNKPWPEVEWWFAREGSVVEA
jgi:phosphoribosyl 1,2-cyclic phosphodiesterase